jgi:hypothetical protein
VGRRRERGGPCSTTIGRTRAVRLDCNEAAGSPNRQLKSMDAPWRASTPSVANAPAPSRSSTTAPLTPSAEWTIRHVAQRRRALRKPRRLDVASTFKLRAGQSLGISDPIPTLVEFNAFEQARVVARHAFPVWSGRRIGRRLKNRVRVGKGEKDDAEKMKRRSAPGQSIALCAKADPSFFFAFLCVLRASVPPWFSSTMAQTGVKWAIQPRPD